MYNVCIMYKKEKKNVVLNDDQSYHMVWYRLKIALAAYIKYSLHR